MPVESHSQNSPTPDLETSLYKMLSLMPTDWEVIEQSAIFRNTPEAAKSLRKRIEQERTVKAQIRLLDIGHTLYQKDDVSDGYVFILLSGQLTSWVHGIPINQRYPGDMLGDSDMVRSYIPAHATEGNERDKPIVHRRATNIATEPSRLLPLRYQSFFDLINEFPAVGIAIAAEISLRMGHYFEANAVAVLKSLPVKERLLVYLWEKVVQEGGQIGDRDVIIGADSQTDIAASIFSSRETVIASLAEFKITSEADKDKETKFLSITKNKKYRQLEIKRTDMSKLEKLVSRLITQTHGKAFKIQSSERRTPTVE